MARYALPFGYVDWPDPDERPSAPSPAFDSHDLEPTARVTLRLPTALKRRVEASAALEGVPPDAWITRTLSRSVDPRLGTS
jgi:hypothetical protein